MVTVSDYIGTSVNANIYLDPHRVFMPEGGIVCRIPDMVKGLEMAYRGFPWPTTRPLTRGDFVNPVTGIKGQKDVFCQVHLDVKS